MGNTTDPYKKVQWRGVTLDNRTKSALIWAEKRYIAEAPKHRQPWRLGQGSYSNSSMSGGTHRGGGSADVMFAGLNGKQRKAVIKWTRKAGFASWARVGPLWGANNDHAHMVLLGHRTASPEAKSQMDSYRAHRDGLAGNAYDTTWRPKRPRRWSHRRNMPVIG